MKSFKGNNPGDIINKKKLLYLPLAIGIIAILTVGFLVFHSSKYLLLEQMKHDGINLAKISSSKISSENKSLEIIHLLIDEKIKVTGNMVGTHKGEMSNDVLRKIARDMGVDEINYFNEGGFVLYSTNNDYVGRKSPQGYPVDAFRLSDLLEYYEEVRNDTVTGIPTKHGYKRYDGGTFVQIGIIESNFQMYSGEFNLQNNVENLAREENIAYALVLNTELEAIADSDVMDIGFIYSEDEDYIKVLRGMEHSFYWHYNNIGKEVLEVAVPIYKESQIVGVLGIGLHLDSVNFAIYINMLITFAITMLATGTYMYFQNQNIIKPVQNLNRNLLQIDIVNDRDYRIPYTNTDSFGGLVKSINHILDEIKLYVTLLHQKDERIQHIAYHDALTDLPNYRAFTEALALEIENKKSGYVILLGIDNFKGINATLGHRYGDQILKKVAEELSKVSHDRLIVSKFEGDKFFLLLKESEQLEIDTNVQRIISIFKNNLVIADSELHVTVSLGITRYPLDSQHVSTLVMNADMALNAMKKSGKNGFYSFKPEMGEALNEKIHIEQIVKNALKEKNFKLVYQPQIDTMSGEIVGFEALLRVKNNPISPMKFIAIAEETGMIIEIGRWVTAEVAGQIAKWKEIGLLPKPISINFSAKQLQDTQYIDFLQRQLQIHDIAAELIELEITESVLLYNKEVTNDFIKQVKDLGIKIAIDDFGTGYSSFSYLSQLPIDKIKIDKSFIDEVTQDKQYKILKGIIGIAHSIQTKIVAEGVETREQYEILKREKCQYLQGYLFSKPVEAEVIIEIFDRKYL